MRTALYGDTALHLAVQAKDLRIASILLRYKADPKAMNSDKSIPLDMAEENGDIDMIELLSERTQDAFLETFEHAGTFRTDMNIDFGVDNSHSTPKSGDKPEALDLTLTVSAVHFPLSIWPVTYWLTLTPSLSLSPRNSARLTASSSWSKARLDLRRQHCLH